MFKQKCSKCNAKVDKKFDFCPYCGKNLKSDFDNEDFGFFGKNDFTEGAGQGLFGGSLIDKMMNSAMKMIEKQMRDLPSELNNANRNFQPNFPKSNMKIKFMVNGKEVPLGQAIEKKVQEPKKINNKISSEKIEKISKLPRTEPKAIMKRLSGKLIYELKVPGVKDIEDVLINQLENSIEVKAIAPKTVYSKTINVNIPVLRYNLVRGLLTLEFEAK